MSSQIPTGLEAFFQMQLKDDLGNVVPKHATTQIRRATITEDVTNNQNIVDVGPWTALCDIDFTALAAQSFSADGPYTIGPYVWTKGNSANEATHASLSTGSGIQFQPASGTDYNGATRTLPYLWLPLPSLFGTRPYDWSTRVRIFSSFGTDNPTTNYDNEVLGIDSNSPAYGLLYKRGFGTGGQGTSYFWQVANANASGFQNDGFTLGAANRTVCVEFESLYADRIRGFTGAGVAAGAAMPGQGSMVPRLQARYLQNAETAGVLPAQLGIFIGAQRAGSGTAFSTFFQRLRVEYG
jgi:hypothetical protein